MTEALEAHIEGDQLMQDIPAPAAELLGKHRRRGQTKVEADMERHIRVYLEVAAHHAVVILGPDRLALLDEGILALSVTAYPIEVLAAEELVVVAGRQVLQVLGLGVRHPPPAGLMGISLSLGHVSGQVSNINIDDTAGLTEEVPLEPAAGLLFLSQTIIPVVIIHRVRIEDNTPPARSAISLGRITAHAVRQAIHHSFWELPALVYPRAGQLQR